jgi:hypothetical protein
LFHFEASDDPVNGAPYPYVVGFDDNVGVYMSEPDALAAETADRLPHVFIDVLQRGDLDVSEHVTLLLQGRHPSDFDIGEHVIDGGKNRGIYAGMHEVELPDIFVEVFQHAGGAWSFTVTSTPASTVGFGSRAAFTSWMDAVRAARQSRPTANIIVQR